MQVEDCSICLEILGDDLEEIYGLNCQHTFHRDCITRWLHTNPNCPLCRQPVDADSRYVQDGIITEERRLYIENMKAVCIWTAKGLEWLAPECLKGYTEKTTHFLESEEGKEILENASENTNLPSNLFWTLGTSGLTQFIANGGLISLFDNTL